VTAMPKPDRSPAALDALSVPERSGTSYPEPYRAAVAGRHFRQLGDQFGLSQFGVNLVRLEPGAISSQRHWHEAEDEFVYVLEGHPTLVTDEGETPLGPGAVAGFAADRPNGHHLVNRTDRQVLFLAVGTRAIAERCHYPDVDMEYRCYASGEEGYWRKNGERYP